MTTDPRAQPTTAAPPLGLSHYEFRPLPDNSGVQVSQSGKEIRLDWTSAFDLAAALIDAYRRATVES